MICTENCEYYDYDTETGFGHCNHPDWEEDQTICPGEYSKQDAKNDAKYSKEDRY